MAEPSMLFGTAVWMPAMEKFGAVTHLTVTVYDRDAGLVCGPVPSSPLHAFFERHGYEPQLMQTCAVKCLAQSDDLTPLVMTDGSGLAVVGTAVSLDGEVVGAAVAGYALVDFSTAAGVERLARHAGVPFRPLWDLVRQHQPESRRRLVVIGELLQVLADTILRENAQTRQSEEIATELKAVAAAKDEFLAVLSHELRTPLTPILGWTRMLAMATNVAQAERAAQVIERNALLQLRLVDDLLELNRASRGKLNLTLSVHCLQTVLAGAIEAVAEKARQKHVAVDLDAVPELLCMNADSDRLQQVFRNVLTNAVKFTPSGGSIKISLWQDAGWGVVRVRDSGEGIAPDFLPFIFDIFRQQEDGTRRQHGGLGIGLSLVKRLTEAHQGDVKVTSEGVGRGAEVTIRLPLVDHVAEPATLTARPGPVLSLEGVRVLVIEDTEDSRDTTRMMLEHVGAAVAVAADGIDGLEAMSHADFDVVLCDLRMPRMDGYEFLKELHRDGSRLHPPVVAMTGLAGSVEHRKTAVAGFQAHIDKPFDETTLLAAVGSLMERYGVVH